MTKIAIAILTKNEKENILPLLKIFDDFCHESVDLIYFLDDLSDDGTYELVFSERLNHKIPIMIDRIKISDSFAYKKNYVQKRLKEYDWILHHDADERFDKSFLSKLRGMAEDYHLTPCIRFPRINLPHGENYPDYQVRFVKNNKDVEWKGKVHEVPYSKSKNVPLDKLEHVVTCNDTPIMHLPRNGNKRRPWW